MTPEEEKDLQRRIDAFKRAKEKKRNWDDLLRKLAQVNTSDSDIGQLIVDLERKEIRYLRPGNSAHGAGICSLHKIDQQPFIDEFIDTAKTIVARELQEAQMDMEDA